MRVVGLGTQDGFAQAQAFVERNGTTTPLMTWADSLDAWSHFEVTGQPVIVLVDQNGQEISRWNGLPQEVSQMLDRW